MHQVARCDDCEKVRLLAAKIETINTESPELKDCENCVRVTEISMKVDILEEHLKVANATSSLTEAPPPLEINPMDCEECDRIKELIIEKTDIEMALSDKLLSAENAISGAEREKREFASQVEQMQNELQNRLSEIADLQLENSNLKDKPVLDCDQCDTVRRILREKSDAENAMSEDLISVKAILADAEKQVSEDALALNQMRAGMQMKESEIMSLKFQCQDLQNRIDMAMPKTGQVQTADKLPKKKSGAATGAVRQILKIATLVMGSSILGAVLAYLVRRFVL